MTSFGICDNSLDFDTTENMKKNSEEKNKKTESKSSNQDDLPRFNKEELELLKSNVEWIKDHATADDLIQAINTKYRTSNDMKKKIADVRKANK